MNKNTVPIRNQSDFHNKVVRERVTPQSLESEQSTLGAMLMECEAVDDATDILSESDFYRQIHRIIFGVVVGLHSRNEPIDLITVISELRRIGKLDEVGGSAYIMALIESCPSAANVKKYAGEVKHSSLLRQILRNSELLQSRVYADEANANEIIEHAGRVFYEMTTQGNAGGLVRAGEIADNAMECLQKRIESPNHIIGLSTGLADLDRVMRGLKPSELIILAARPKMGKSALLMQIAWNVAFDQDKPVMIFSLEMSSLQLMDRMICHVGGVDSYRYQTGFLAQDEKVKAKAATHKIKSVPMYFDDAAGLSVFQMMTRIRRVAMQNPPGLIVVDYLQLATSGHGKENRVEEVDAITTGLAAIAKQFKCPVLAAAQLSRAVEQREDKRPMLSDLRESGSIEATANMVAFIYRLGYYSKDRSDQTAEIIIAANRSGAPGVATVDFWPEQSRFVNRANEKSYEGHEHYANR